MDTRRYHRYGTHSTSDFVGKTHVATKGLGTFKAIMVKSLDEAADAEKNICEKNI